MGRTEVSDLKTDYERALVGMAEPSTKSEMARSSECTEQYAQKVLDTADFVRDAC
jgi:hypothetical protein